MVQSIPLFSLSTEWRAGGPHWHCKWSRRPTLTVAVHCAYFVSPALALQVEPKAHTQSGEVSTVCGMDEHVSWPGRRTYAMVPIVHHCCLKGWVTLKWRQEAGMPPATAAP